MPDAFGAAALLVEPARAAVLVKFVLGEVVLGKAVLGEVVSVESATGGADAAVVWADS